MTAYDPVYLLTLYAPRSIDPDECTVLTPVAGAPHAQAFRVGTRSFGKAVRIGATTARYLIRNPVGTWPTTALTVEYWGRLDTGLSTAQENVGFSYARQTVEFNELGAFIGTNAGNWRQQLTINGSGVQDADNFPNDHQWHHLAFTWLSSGGVWAMYLDGALVASGTGLQSGYSLAAGGIVVLGQDQDSAGGSFDATQAWKGELDEVRVYSRVLSATEVKRHFGGIFLDETGLCARWGFDLAGSLLGRDSSSVGNDLTPVGIDAATDDTILHFYPYLRHPESGRRGRVDVRNKTSDTGVMTFELVDPQLPGSDPLARWLPAFLGNLKGQIRAGGLAARAWESLNGGLTMSGFWAGRLRTLEQLDPVHYHLTARELADDLQALAFVGRPHPDVFYAGFTSILPVSGVSVPAAEKAIVSSSVANPSVITMAAPHGYATGDRITIGGHAGSTPAINGDWTITVTGSTTFTIPVNVTVAGSGGHASKFVVASSVAYGTLLAAAPLKGTIVSYAPYPKGRRVVLDNRSRARADNFMTQNLLEACPLGDENLFARHAAGAARPMARVRLRRVDTGAVGYFLAAFSLAAPWAIYVEKGRVRVAEIGIVELETTEVGYMAFPADSTAVEVWVEAEHRATANTPLLIGDVHPVTLWRHLLEGKFGFRWTPPEVLPAGKGYGDPRLPIPYHAAKFAALEADLRFPLVRFVITKRQPRGPWIQQQLLRAANLAYYFDGDGVLNPVDLRTPTDVSSVPTITDADLELAAPTKWQYDRSKAITRADAAYYEDVTQQTSAEGGTTLGSLVFPLISGGALKEIRHPVTIIDLGNTDLGDEPFELDLAGFRAMAGESLGGQPRATYLERRLIDLAIDTARPFGVGAPTLPLSCKRGSAGDALPGELRKITIRSVPDPATNKLGGTRLVRVSERMERKGFIETRVTDLGLPNVAGTPTLGVPAQEGGNTQDGVTVDVTLNGAGDPVEVHYAVTDTSVGSAPATNDVKWTPVASGLVRTTSTLTFRGLPAGRRIWVRGRSFPDTRVNYSLPSAWVAASAPGRVDLAALSAPSAPASSLITSRTFRVSWTNGSADLATEILIATPTTDPRTLVARVAPGSVLYDFPGKTGLVLQPSTTYRVGLRHTDGVDSVSAEVTIDLSTTAVDPTMYKPFRPPFQWR